MVNLDYETHLTKFIFGLCLEHSTDKDLLKNKFGHCLCFMSRNLVEGCDTFRINRLMFLALQCWIGRCDECMATMRLISWWPRNITAGFGRLGNIRYVVKACFSWLCSLMILLNLVWC